MENLEDFLARAEKIYKIEHNTDGAIESRCTSLVCKKCGEQPNKYGQDACIAELGLVMNACCGHGGEGYIQFDSGITIRGNFKIEYDRRD